MWVIFNTMEQAVKGDTEQIVNQEQAVKGEDRQIAKMYSAVSN